jgi:hypothetical protein
MMEQSNTYDLTDEPHRRFPLHVHILSVGEDALTYSKEPLVVVCTIEKDVNLGGRNLQGMCFSTWWLAYKHPNLEKEEEVVEFASKVS